MNSKIYVGNILYEITDQDLKDLFSPFGEVVSAEVVRYQKSKRSKGFGFVKMATLEQAQAAIQALNDQDFRGRKLFLDLAKSEDPTAEVREKQQQTSQGAVDKAEASYTPMPAQPIQPAQEVQPENPVEMPVEEIHPDIQVEPPAPVQEVPVQASTPEPPAQPQEEQPIRTFGTIFSNSPRTNEDQ